MTFTLIESDHPFDIARVANEEDSTRNEPVLGLLEADGELWLSGFSSDFRRVGQTHPSEFTAQQVIDLSCDTLGVLPSHLLAEKIDGEWVVTTSVEV